jgi:hypothetical protein
MVELEGTVFFPCVFQGFFSILGIFDRSVSIQLGIFWIFGLSSFFWGFLTFFCLCFVLGVLAFFVYALFWGFLAFFYFISFPQGPLERPGALGGEY